MSFSKLLRSYVENILTTYSLNECILDCVQICEDSKKTVL